MAVTGSEQRVEITNAVVRILRDFTGRGATTAKAIMHDDVVVVLTGDVLTKAERMLIDQGEEELVVLMRTSLQEAMRPALTEAVETIMGRKVRALISGVNIDPDIWAETFVLGDELD